MTKEGAGRRKKEGGRREEGDIGGFPRSGETSARRGKEGGRGKNEGGRRNNEKEGIRTMEYDYSQRLGIRNLKTWTKPLVTSVKPKLSKEQPDESTDNLKGR